jgi:hypothetical protein
MDKKTKILMWGLILATIVSVGITYYKTIVLQDFEVVYTESDDEVVLDESTSTDQNIEGNSTDTNISAGE